VNAADANADAGTAATRASWVSLLTSSGTLICCTLPALLVAVGAGATMITLTSAIPQLVWLSMHKEAVFIFAAIMLAIAGAMQWRARTAPCPIDPALARSCMQTRARARWIYFGSVLLFAIGALFAFVLPALLFGE
jgi:hypothetical protein